MHPTSFCLKLQGCRINSVALEIGWRAIIKYMPKVGITMIALNFNLFLAGTEIIYILDDFFCNSFMKIGPSTSGIILCL
jgi:hypothetical protein